MWKLGLGKKNTISIGLFSAIMGPIIFQHWLSEIKNVKYYEKPYFFLTIFRHLVPPPWHYEEEKLQQKNGKQKLS